MSLPPLDLTLPTDHLHVTRWCDPVVDLVGHDLRSAYVEHFWLPILGPTTTLLLRRLAAGLDEHPDGFDLPMLDTATALGLGTKGGRNAPFLRAIARATQFKVTRPAGPGGLAVRHRIPPLTRAQTERLPAPIRDEHADWQTAAQRRPDVDQQRRRARRLALSLLELGETHEATEQQLHRWKFHPALAHEALLWAVERQHQGPDTAAVAAAGAPPARPGAGRRPPIPPPPRPAFRATPDGRPVPPPAGTTAAATARGDDTDLDGDADPGEVLAPTAGAG